MRTFGRIGAALAVLFLLATPVARAQDTLTRRDGRGPVTVVATLLPAESAGGPTRIKIALDTHSVGLDTIALDRAVTLRRADGSEIAPTAVEATGSGHHRSAVLSFPAGADDGVIRVVVRDVGGVAERVLTWDRPAPR